MSKRRRKKSQPNIPQETLDRARADAGVEPMDEVAAEPVDIEEVEEEEVVVAEAAQPVVAESSRSRRRRDISRKQQNDVSQRERDQERIAEMLDNPTIQVPEQQLRAEYSYVLKDIRSMFILAAILFILMIVIAIFVI